MKNFISGLGGARILVLSSIEAITSEIYATLTVEGLENQLIIPEAGISTLKDVNISNVIALIAEIDAKLLQLRLDELLKLDFPFENILVGTPPGSFLHRLSAKVGNFDTFNFNFLKTAVGPEIELPLIVNALLKKWAKIGDQILNIELESARSSGALSLLCSTLGISESAIIESAYVANSVATSLSLTLDKKRKLIQLAIYGNISKLPNALEVINNSRRLWGIKKEIEELSASCVISKDQSVSTQIHLATDIVLSAVKSGSSDLDTHFKNELKVLPFELRVQFKLVLESIAQSFQKAKREAS